MKTRYVICTAVASLGLLFSACQPEEVLREPSPMDDNQVQAFIFNNTGDITMMPAGGDSVYVTWSGGTFVSAEPVFPIVIGRNVKTEAVSFDLEVFFKDSEFVVNPKVSFAEGEDVDTLWVTSLLDYGQSSTFSVQIPKECEYSYAPQSVTVAVSADYTWVPMGTVTMSSQWEGAMGVVPIEKAKEFMAEDGSMLFRLKSPYYILAPEYCTVPGLHLMFYLNADYSAKGLTAVLNKVENTGYDWIYWSEEYVGVYEFFESDGNEYSLTAFWTDGSGLSLDWLATESWVWDNGYPGK